FDTPLVPPRPESARSCPPSLTYRRRGQRGRCARVGESAQRLRWRSVEESICYTRGDAMKSRHLRNLVFTLASSANAAAMTALMLACIPVDNGPATGTNNNFDGFGQQCSPRDPNCVAEEPRPEGCFEADADFCEGYDASG